MKSSSLEFICPRCGWTHLDHAATGQLRCSACLAAAVGLDGGSSRPFRKGAVLTEIDSSRGMPQRILAELVIGLQLAVKQEDFELAVILRDMLSALQAELTRERPGRDGFRHPCHAFRSPLYAAFSGREKTTLLRRWGREGVARSRDHRA